MGVHDGHRSRLRSRFLAHGMDTLEDHEVLELLLFFVIHRKDTNELAHKLINHFGSLAGVLDAQLSELLQVEGIGKRTAELLLICKPLCRRYLICQNDDKQSLNNVAVCAQYLKPFFFGAKEEHVFLLCLDAKCRPICCRELSQGSATTTELPIRKAAQLALDSRAVSVIIAHNHPAGDPLPSPEDYHSTDQLKQTLSSIGVILADHIIICGSSHSSMAQSGYLSY